jgi:hypothetical protein
LLAPRHAASFIVTGYLHGLILEMMYRGRAARFDASQNWKFYNKIITFLCWTSTGAMPGTSSRTASFEDVAFLR